MSKEQTQGYHTKQMIHKYTRSQFVSPYRTSTVEVTWSVSNRRMSTAWHGGSTSTVLSATPVHLLNDCLLVCFSVSWSSVPSFTPLLGETVIEDVTQLQYDITGLTAVSIRSKTYYKQYYNALESKTVENHWTKVIF